MAGKKSLKEDVVKFLKTQKEDVSVSFIASSMGKSYPSISKWIAVLEAEKLLAVRYMGQVKLCKLKRSKR